MVQRSETEITVFGHSGQVLLSAVGSHDRSVHQVADCGEPSSSMFSF